MPVSPADPVGRRVLLVEDDADSRDMYAMVLGFAGFDVHAVGDASAAFELAVARHPDVIVTDFTLRGPDNGAALCRRLHADARTADIPVLVVTGSTRPADAEALRGAGCAEIRTKPYLPDALIVDVEYLVSRSRQGRPAQAL